jgi:hypothetical protein
MGARLAQALGIKMEHLVPDLVVGEEPEPKKPRRSAKK